MDFININVLHCWNNLDKIALHKNYLLSAIFIFFKALTT